MSEEDELRVKFVIDDTDFRNQLDQLRGDLERERRLEPGEADRPLQSNIDIHIGDGGGMSGDVREELRQLRSDIDNLERRSGLPNQFRELTLNDLNNMVKEATQSPAWISTVSAGITERLLGESAGMASRAYADVPMGTLMDDASRSSAVGAALRMYRASLLSGREELLGEGRGAGRGLDTQVTELESMRARGPRVATGEAFETVAHSVMKGIGRTFLVGTGKIETRSEVFEQIPGFRKKFDVLSLFYGTGRESGRGELPALHAPEAKTGRIMGDSTVSQVAEQIMLGLGILQRDYGLTLHDIASDPEILGEVAGYASRLTSTVISLEEHSPEEVLDFEGKVISKVMGYWKSSMSIMGETEENVASAMGVLRTVFSRKGVKVGVLVMSPKMRGVMAAAADEASNMRAEDQINYVRDKMLAYLDSDAGKEDYDLWYGAFNPTFSEDAQAQIRKKMTDAKERIRRMITEGVLDRPEAEAQLRGVMEESVGTGGAFGAAYAARDVFGGGSMEGLPSIGDRQITSRIGGRPARKGAVKRRILDKRFISGILDSMVEEGVTEDQAIEALSISLGVSDLDPAIAARRGGRPLIGGFRTDVARLRAEDPETTGMDMDMRFGIEHDDGTFEDYGTPTAMEMTESILAELEFDVRPMGALPMGLDLQQYMKTLDVYAKGMEDEFPHVSMTAKKYMRWLGSKRPGGGLPGDISEGLSDALGALGREDAAVTGRLIPSRFSDFIGDPQDPRMPVNQEEINYIREQLVEVRENIRLGTADFSEDDAGIIMKASQELEAFEKMYTAMEPATTIMSMMWS